MSTWSRVIRQQERFAHPVQPRPQKGPGADPRRQAHMRVVGHHPVHRRGFQRSLLSPPGRPLRARRRSVLGCFHRRQAHEGDLPGVMGQDGGGEVRGDEADIRGDGGPGRSLEGVLQGEELLWRRQPRVCGRGARRHPRLGARHGGNVGRRRQDLRPYEDPPPVRMGRQLCRAGRGRGGHAGRGQDGGVCHEDAVCCCGRGSPSG